MKADKQTTGKIVSRPSAAQARTAGSEEKKIQAIVEAVNPVIADGFALYEKTKNFSLNADGERHPDNKILFDEQAREIFASTDTLAEQMRQIGAAPLRSISHSGELQGIENYNGDFLSPGEMIAELIVDHQQIAASMRLALMICRKIGEAPLGVIVRDALDKTEKRIEDLNEAAKKI